LGGSLVNMKEITYKPIGLIHSQFRESRGTPIQAIATQNVEARVEIFPEYAAGLKDIDGFSHIMLIYHFHRSKTFSLMVKPYLDDKLRGLFSTRAPSRPNPIGMSIVKLKKIEKNNLQVGGVDILDETPLLDIKPYVPEFDAHNATKKGWLEEKIHTLNIVRANGRFRN